MPRQVVTGAVLKCSMCLTPGSFVATPKQVRSSYMDAANIMDHKPLVNILPFGACMSLANPTVASATAAAQGVLTPMPCVPNTPSPWFPGAPTVPIQFLPALDDISMCMCVWGGLITVTYAGQATENIP